jgi:glycosyl transferase family 92
MDARRWHQFLSFLERARSKPAFEAEEREYRLHIAEELSHALRVSPDSALIDAFENVFERPRPGREYDLTDPKDSQWLLRWGRAPGSSLPAILRGFADSGADPMTRFERFARAAEEAGVADDVGAVLAFGSLLNFAHAPESAPVVKSEQFDGLEATLGCAVSAQESALEQYRRHVGFTTDVLTRARETGVAILDVLDAASLILVASESEDFWATGIDAGGPLLAPREGAPYLSVCAIYRDEAPYLREWIEFHRLVGVERFFLYDNESVDHHRDVLAPYIEDGTVVLHDWHVIPGRRNQYRRRASILNPQRVAYNDCLRWHRRDSRWIAFIDVDEFLFSPTGARLTDLLREYERWPGVVVNWAMFQSSGHRARPQGTVIGNYRIRLNSPKNHLVKSIVQPAHTVRSRSGHHFLYTSLPAVDENHYPVASSRTKSVSFSRLRVNHYFTKSEEELIQKLARRRVGGKSMAAVDLEDLRQVEERTGEPDESILIYLDQLEEALGARSGSR